LRTAVLPAPDDGTPPGDAAATAAAEAGPWLRAALSAVLDDEHDLARIATLRLLLEDDVARLP
jgi:hypothetical protein